MTYNQLNRWILTAIVVVVLPGLLMLSVIGWADESVKGDQGSLLAFAAVLVPMWVLWFATIRWIIRAGRPTPARPLAARSR